MIDEIIFNISGILDIRIFIGGTGSSCIVRNKQTFRGSIKLECNMLRGTWIYGPQVRKRGRKKE
jgi:hypothetical protein